MRHFISNRICRAVQSPRILLHRILSTNKIVGSPLCFQPVQCIGAGTVSVEPNVRFGVFPSPFFFSTYAYLEARKPSAAISIGSGTCINNNFCAIAEHTTITIGRNCLIGTGVEIMDSDFHGLTAGERRISRPERAKPVRVGDNVFVGSNVKILKGVCIGSGAVIANGSVVTKDVPNDAIAAGNPARLLGLVSEHG